MPRRALRVKAGDAFAVPLRDERFGLVRVLKIVREDGVAGAIVALTDWLGDRLPSLPIAPRPQVLKYARPLGDEIYFLINISSYFPEPPAEFKYLGTIEATEEEQGLICKSHSDWSGLWEGANQEWRSRQVRPTPREEDRIADVNTKEQVVPPANQGRDYLEAITLEQLRETRRFFDWELLPPLRIRRKVEGLFRAAVNALVELGPWGSLENKVSVFKALVGALNDLDGETGFIETDEREDMLTLIEEMAHATGIPQVMDFVGEWTRDW